MKIILTDSYLDTASRKVELERQLEELEQVLLTPERTTEDIIRHMELLKELNSLN